MQGIVMRGMSIRAPIGFAGLVLLFVIEVSCAGPKGVMMPRSMIAGAEYVGMETCGFCHEKQV